MLLAHASGFSGAALVAFPERSLSEEAAARFAAFAERRRRGEPVAYIVGEKEFYGLAITVTPAVLIPRPETELLVELALERRFASVVDLGTGSGAIALALKKHRPAARVVGVEARDLHHVARVRGVDELVVADVDPDVAGDAALVVEEHEVPRQQISLRWYQRAGVVLVLRDAGQGDACPGVRPLHESRAVEAGG